MRIRSLTIVLFAIALSAMPAAAAEEAPTRTLTLQNGLDLVLMPDATSPLLSTLLIVHAGSSYETLAEAGATHLLEHMIFRGTHSRSQKQIYDSLDRMGAYYNAQTSKTYTMFILVTPRESAMDAMEIQADMILNSTIDPDTFEVEKGRVLAEIAQSHERPGYMADVHHMTHVYGETAYGFPTLGTEQNIRALSAGDVKRFHDDWYAANNMTLVMRGDMSFEEMEKHARQVYGDLVPQPLPQRPASWPEGLENWRQGRLHKTYSDVRSGTLNITLSAPRYDAPEAPAFKALTLLLDDRLDEHLRGGSRPLATHAYSSLVLDPWFSVVDITVGLMPGVDPQTALNATLEAVRSLAEESWEAEELHRAITEDRLSELFFAEQVQYGAFLLVPKLAVAPYGFWSSFDNALTRVGAEEAREVALGWFGDPYWVASAHMPRPEQELGEGVTMGPVVMDTLDNGLILAVREARNVPVSGIHMIAKHRALHEGPERRGWVDLLHRLLPEGYGNNVDREYIDRMMTDIGMEMQTVDDPRVPMDNYRTTPEYSFVRIESRADRWRDALDLLGRLLASGTLDDASIQRAVDELQGIVRRGGESLSGKVDARFDSLLYGPHELGRSVYGDGSSLRDVNPVGLAELRSEVFGADNLVISLLAPAPADTILKEASVIFGGLPQGNVPTPQSPAAQMTEAEETITGKGRTARLATGFLLEDVDPADHAALMVANSLISDAIYRDLGEAKGWAYGAGSSVTLRDGWGAWSAGLGLPQEHLEEALEAIHGHVKDVARGRFDEERFAVARGDLRGKVLRRYSSRINLAMGLGRDLFLHDDPLYTWEMYEQIAALTLDDVKRAAKRYLRPDGYVTVRGVPKEGDDKPSGMPPGMMGGMGH